MTLIEGYMVGCFAVVVLILLIAVTMKWPEERTKGSADWL